LGNKTCVLTMRSAPSTCIGLPSDQYRTCNVRQTCGLAVAQRHVDVLPFPGLCAAEQGGQYGVGGVKAGRKVGNGDTDFNGWAIARPSDMHKAELAVDHCGQVWSWKEYHATWRRHKLTYASTITS